MIARIMTIVCAAVLVLPLSGCGEGEQPREKVVRPVRMLTVGSAESMITRRFPGKVEASGRVELAFEVAGKIVKLPIASGQEIERGALVARLDDRDFRAKLQAAESRATKAKADLVRYERLLGEEVVSRAAYDQIKKDYDVARADAQIAAKALQDAEVTAPFSGVIGDKFVENFQNVQAKQAIATLQNDTIVEVGIDIPQDVAIEAQKSVDIVATTILEAAPDKEFKLQLKEFSREADPQTRTYHVRLFMPAPESKIDIFPGMTTTVSLKYADVGREGYSVPVSAVLDEGGETFVWKVKPDMTVTKSPVGVGLMSGENISVIKGLAEGDRIATAGVHYLREGQKVRVLTGKIGD